MAEGVSIIIPACNGGLLFRQCLAAIRDQDFRGEVELIVVDSGSEDDSLEAAQEAGALLRRIPKQDFHHARTRNDALSMATHPKVIFLVQDAIPASRNWLCLLTGSLQESAVVAAYARQIPHADADAFARFEVEHHGEYLGDRPTQQFFRDAGEFTSLPYDRLLRTIRLDNVCAIYRKEFLTRFPFPDVRFGEDMAWASTVLKKGCKIAYRPEIVVRHSHSRSPDYRFRRAIVDSLACAQITGRVKTDLSAFGLKDLLRLREEGAAFGAELRDRARQGEDIGRQRIGLGFRLVQKIRRTFPGLSPLLAPLLSVKGDQSGFGRLVRGNVQNILFLIDQRYPGLSVEELLGCVDQAMASTLGRFHGEVYASHEIKQTVPDELREYFRPLLDGV